jgi:AAA+ ATPase superfamily predicted ATPase
MSVGIVKKERPFREENSKKIIYALDDNIFRFWYRFIPDYISLIQRGESDLAYKNIAPQIPAYMGSVFEEICKQYLWRLNLSNKAPIQFTDAGRWWGNDPRKKAEREIDIIAANREDAIFAECKWRGEAVGADTLDTLIERSELFHYKNRHYYLFAKTGFTNGLIEKADKLGCVSLVSYPFV